MSTAEQSAVRLQRLIALTAIALVASTWRLWTPDTDFPQIPWFAWGCRMPAMADWGALAGLIAGCLVLLSAGSKSLLRQRGLWLFAVSLVVFFARVLSPNHGAMHDFYRENPRNPLSWLRYFWFALGFVLPMLLAGLASTGYVYTATQLGSRLTDTKSTV